MPFQYAHSRKAAYQYSWDWAPYLNTMGIWKPVYILYYKKAYIDYVWIRNRQVNKNYALLNIATALNLGDNDLLSSVKKHRIQIKYNQS